LAQACFARGIETKARFDQTMQSWSRAVSHSRRTLFLDDDPARAKLFQDRYPGAIWVRTVEECLALLSTSWDEVHLDHDLGGEVFVDHDRGDCGMAVVRWLCQEPRPHLLTAQFIVHSHNANAACMMAFQLTSSGYQAKVQPFGTVDPAPGPSSTAAHDRRCGPPRLLSQIVGWLRSGRTGG
jgi:hypothetical protein